MSIIPILPSFTSPSSAEDSPSTSSTTAPATDPMLPPTPKSSLPISAARASLLNANLADINARISRALTSTSTSTSSSHQQQQRQRPRLVAVSKLHPANDILALHQNPNPTRTSHVHFGENYLQELLTKSELLPRSIKWHFIGALQSNKCKPLAEQIPNLWCVESVDSIKKAEGLEKGRKALKEKEKQKDVEDGEDGKEENDDDGLLKVFVQVNTSNEPEKAGVDPTKDDAKEVLDLCQFIKQQCPHLSLLGLMTIGAIARSQAAAAKEGEENEDFVTLRQVRDKVAGQLGLADKVELELSMGMSDDFESAIRCGSNEVRVGSTIFGQRPAKQDAKVQADVETGAN